MQHADEIRYLKLSIAELNKQLDLERARAARLATALDRHIKDTENEIGLLQSNIDCLFKTDADLHKTIMSVGRVIRMMRQELKTLFMYSRETLGKIFPGIIDHFGELDDIFEPPKKD